MEIISSEYGRNSERIEGCALRCGTDVTITLCGGTKPHVGAVSMACYEPERDSATVSTVTAYRHRDDVLSAACAKRASKELKCTVTVSVGIHVDDADIKMIEQLRQNCMKCFEILLDKIERKRGFTMDELQFNENNYEVKTYTIDQDSITCRAYEGISYCAAPVAAVQVMNIYVPEAYYQDGKINGYDLHTAPIFMPNTVGGYMEGPADMPGRDRSGHANSVFRALEHGYVVACAGIRGRTTGRKNMEFFEGSTGRISEVDNGRMVGKAPALIVDMKAAIRYLRYNKDNIPGNTERIITNGTSAGGALSALAGATGNSTDYEPYLKKIGAAEERDDIFAASCYCPIHNLENADAAYEWLFCGCNEFYRTMHKKTEHGIERVPFTGTMTDKQIAMSVELKALFPAYVNSLHLTDGSELLTLREDGTGSFLDYVKSYVIQSAQKELDDHMTQDQLPWLQVEGSQIEQQDYLVIEDGKVVDLDWDAFVKKITRMKATPAFDAVDLNSPENEEFGTEEVEKKHFAAYSAEHSEAHGEMADAAVIQMLNPTKYIPAEKQSDVALHWRIRHGAFDRDTSLAIPVILATLLQNNGYDVDFMLPWGLPHSGDYDLDELFAWIDGLCA